ncbi:hypothetical protein SAMN05443252_105179 [Bacillus sp. OV322]|uniref:hypothetical protein n=1 Tax=Bacillus sp. OV322 TaxID=1882764 RepID=UPI0008E53167|nr:hypothetical protein [Bacillus sp. OV322]SFC67021.1 hypothetical protein SAMN05443252_105179 [Bacillus sp. OV322]
MNLVWYCLGVIATFIIMGLSRGNFEWLEWDNLIPVVGGFIGIAVVSYRSRRTNKTRSL